MSTARVLGDSQGQGLLPVLGPFLAARGYQFDETHSWTRPGAGIAEIAQHAAQVGNADLVLIVSGGGNDAGLLGLRDAGESYRAKFRDLVSTLRSQGVSQVIVVGPMVSDDPAVARLHDAARAIQRIGFPGARWIDMYPASSWVPHPDGNPTHWTIVGYRRLAAELDRAIFESGTRTAVGLAGTLTALGAAGIVLTEWLYERDLTD